MKIERKDNLNSVSCVILKNNYVYLFRNGCLYGQAAKINNKIKKAFEEVNWNFFEQLEKDLLFKKRNIMLVRYYDLKLFKLKQL